MGAALLQKLSSSSFELIVTFFHYFHYAQGYRQDRFNVSVNTNNGIERQNLSLKYKYLDKKKARSLSQLIPLHSLSGMERVFLLQLWVIHGR
jgi:hypothetical protein